MSVKLTCQKYPNSIFAEEMQDGFIGEITHSTYPDYIGRIVMRNGSNLVTIGETLGKSWSNFFLSRTTGMIKVRLLQRGEQLTIL